jgi:hypothetical protein
MQFDVYVIEYSVKQDTIHIQPLLERLKKNLNLAIDKISCDYQPIAIASNHDSAVKISEQFRTILNFRNN